MQINDIELYALKRQARPRLLELATLLFPYEKILDKEFYIEIANTCLLIHRASGYWHHPGYDLNNPIQGDIGDLIVYACKVDYETAHRSLKEFVAGTLERFPTGIFELDISSIEGKSLPSFARSHPIAMGKQAVIAATCPELTTVNNINLVARPVREINPFILPRRDWLYGKHYISQNVSATVSPGGVGKSSLSLAEAAAIATGRNIIGILPTRPVRVWYINGEDSSEEIERRVAGIMLRHNISYAELASRLFITSGRECDIVITKTERNTMTLYEPMLNALIDEITRNNIEVVILDPFVTIHGANENDNGQMNQVIKALRTVAHTTSAAIELVHHTRKLNGADTSMDDARGASALQGGVRSMRTLSRMQKSDAEALGIEDHHRYIRVDDAKNNMAPPGKAWWLRLTSVSLPNGPNGSAGDEVGVVEGWQYPAFSTDTYTNDRLEKVRHALGSEWHRSHPRATGWIGHIIAPCLGLDSTNKQHVKRLEAFILHAIAQGALKMEIRKMPNGNDSPCDRVADWEKLSPPPASPVK